MSLYFAIPIMLLAASAQSVWLENVRFLGGRPDLIMLLVVTWSIIRGAEDGALWGFVGGICCDALSGGPFGLWTFTLTSVGYVVGQPWVYLLGPTYIRLVLMAGFGTLLGHTLLVIAMSLLAYPISLGEAMQTIAVPAALLNVILSPVAFTVLVWFHKRARVRVRGFAE